MLNSNILGNGRVRRFLSVILTAAMFFTSVSVDSLAAYADEADFEVKTETVEETVVNSNNYEEGFELWFNSDGATSIAAGQQGDYPVYAGDNMTGKTNKITVDGVEHYSVQGSNNPKKDGTNPNGKIPTSGAYLKVVAPADGTITVFGYAAAGKPFYATCSDTDIEGANLSSDTFCDNNRHTVSVHSGEEWYFYAQGSKAQFAGVVFELPKASVEIPISFSGADLGDATISFTNLTTKDVVTVNAASTSVTLVDTYKYSVAINSALLTIDVELIDLSTEIPESIVINIESARQHEVSGTINGLPEGRSVTSLSFADESGAVTEASVDGNTYSVSLKNGNYTAVATTDANGYTVYDHVAVAGTEGEAISNDVWFYEAATVYGSEYKAVLKVGKSEENDYATITEAVAAAKAMARDDSQWVTIELTESEYVEQVIVNANNIKLVAAEGVNPVIRWYYGIGYKYYSLDSTGYYNEKCANDKYEMNYAQRWGATVRVTGTGFIAEGINFVNTFNLYVCNEELGDSKVGSSAEYGQSISGSLQERTLGLDVANATNVERAAAIVLDGDKAELYKCSFTSSQDTVYTGSNKAYFNDCVIVGQTDYIFGNTGCSAVFDNCELKWLGYTAGSKAGYITATRGSYLFRGCTVTSNTDAGYTVTAGYFGRPWGNTAKVAFVGTAISEGAVSEIGWSDMSGVKPTDVEFREYGNCIGSELSDDSSKFFYSSYAKDTENTSAALSKEAAELLADNTDDSAYLGSWTPVNKASAIDLSKVSSWATTEEPSTDDEPSSEEHGIGIDEAGTIASTYVLEAKNLTTFAAGAKTDGQAESAGTDDYFTIQYSAKSKVDSSSKTFEDAYTSSQRINLGGLADLTKNSIKFTTTTDNAVVKVWWAEGGDDNRQMTLLNAQGEKAYITDGTYTKNSPYICQFTVENPGTYYLGGATNNNYIFKVEVTESVTYVWEEKEYVLDAGADLTAFAAGSKADGDTDKAGTENYFSLQYSAKSKVDASSKTFEDGYVSTQRINFGGAASPAKNSVKITTTASNASVKIWWVEGGDDNRQMAALDSEGKQVAVTEGTHTKNSVYIDTFTLADAGTYYIGGATNNNYLFKIVVTEKKLTTGVEEKPARLAWDEVAAPVITGATQTDNSNSIVVTVEGTMGYDGADKVTVSMIDEAGKVVSTKSSSKEGESVDLTFDCPATGLYTFVAESSRDGEEAVKESAATEAYYFVLVLDAPGMKTVASIGGGKVSLEWEAVSEATGYIVTVNGEKTEGTYGTDVNDATIELKVGSEYVLGVIAVRERVNPMTGETVTDESAIGNTVKTTVVDDVQRAWGFSAYGTSIDKAHNGYTGSVNDGSVTIYSESGKGKLVPNSTDGLAFYYTKINPETENFTLEGTITVDKWTLSNGQDGFGMMVSDTIGVNGSTDTVWNNSYMAMVSKVEYYYDTAAKEVTSDTTKDKITMKLGIGVLARDGITGADMESFAANMTFPRKDGTTGATPENFTTETTTLETSCGLKGTGTYNIIGNYTTDPGNSTDNLTTFNFSIRRNNDGYVIQYKAQDGTVLGTKTIYDQNRTALTQIDPENIYVGFFASRNARITVTDVNLTTVSPEDDDAAGEREITYVSPVYQIESASNANASAYDLVYYGNADGKVSITDNDGNVIATDYEVKANTKAHFAVTLKKGTTNFEITVTPDPNFVPGDYKLLSSYETKTFTHSVSYLELAGEKIYVSNDGSSNGKGTKNSPLDIYTAVKYVQPGQTIILMEGTYSLKSTVKVERGINGTAKNLIYMIADPEATSRPVLDFNGACAGMVLAGDYWYFKGFDVTKSQNAQKGIQVSGNNNTLDDIKTYKNGNTGVQISRLKATDTSAEWPSNNLILNCTSFLNADRGYEDADGFAAKLTVGEGNVFDGCISAFNADDGWDLYAKVETGSIGKVVIKNSVAFMNGYVLDADGKLINAGNGNGFKMGGESLSGYHTLINSVAFANKAKGIDSNSCPDIQVYNSTSFDNESYNVAFYTNNALNTDYYAEYVLSYKKSNSTSEQIKKKGSQADSKIYGETNFFFDGSKSENTTAVTVSDDWFESLDTNSVVEAFKEYISTGVFTTKNGVGVTRNSDGSINLNGYLALTEKAAIVGDKNIALGATLAGSTNEEEPSVKNGVYEEDGVKFLYIDGEKARAGLYLVDGEIYCANYKGQIRTGDVFIQDYNEFDLGRGYHMFDENGCRSHFTGIINKDGTLYYYEDGYRVTRGLVEFEGNYYYVETNGRVTVGDRYVKTTNGLVYAGFYLFEEDGSMSSLIGFSEVGGVRYYYTNGSRKAAGLVEYEGNYYYIGSNGRIYVGRVYVKETNGLMNRGFYNFDEEGKMIVQ